MEFYKRENNNFNIVRMLAAYGVIYAHSFAIQPNGNSDIISRYSKMTHTGQLSVFIFVFLTGIYLCVSLKKSKSFFEFALKKIMRIFPMLIITLLATIGIGALFTTLPLREFFTHSQTKEYFIKNFLNIMNAHELPGVFITHNYSGMNGVLWYLTFVLRIYLVGGILYFFKMFDSKEKANCTLLLLAAWVMVSPDSVPLLGSNIFLYGNPDFPQYTLTVLIASLIFINYPNLKIKWYVPLMFLLLCLVQKDFSYNNTIILWALFAITTSLWIGGINILKNIKIIDVSFSVFLFGWPTSQVICELFPKISPYTNATLTIIITTLIGIIVHFTIDKWSAKLTNFILKISEKTKNKFGRK